MSNDKMREAFEAWYAKKFECDDIFGRYEVSGQYVGTSVEIAWLAWQASRNAQSEADAKDAARYRTLRITGAIVEWGYVGPWKYGDAVDAAIDAAMGDETK